MSLSITVAKVIKIAEIQAKKPKKLLMIEKKKRETDLSGLSEFPF
jgi:hypothetical protein